MFTGEFLDGLPEDPYEAMLALRLEFMRIATIFDKREESNETFFEKFVEAFAVLEALIEAHNIDLSLGPLAIDQGPGENIVYIRDCFRTLSDRTMVARVQRGYEQDRTKYRMHFGAGFLYEFSDGDIKRIQELINELREAITASELFDEKHRQRILKRLEKLQAELHKKMGSIAQIYELTGDFGVMLGKFGEDAKPFADRIREIVQIGWRAEVRAEELASGLPFPLLSDGKEKEEKD